MIFPINDSKELFHALAEKEEEIEKEIGHKLEWMELPGKKASRIKLSTHADLSSKDDWEKHLAWLTETSEKFQKAFMKRIVSFSSE